MGHVVLDILLLFEVFILYHDTNDKLNVVGVLSVLMSTIWSLPILLRTYRLTMMNFTHKERAQEISALSVSTLGPTKEVQHKRWKPDHLYH